MTTFQAFAFGIMIALTPSMALFALTLWCAPTLRENEETPHPQDRAGERL